MPITIPDQIPSTFTGSVLFPEPCPPAVTFQADSCQDAVAVSALDTQIASLGRIVQMDAVIQNVCPGKRVGVAVILTETDTNGNEYPRGVKTMLIPPQEGTECQDVLLKCVSFVVPEEADSAGNASSFCNPRNFRARVLANYLDTDFVCCDPQVTAL